MSTISFVQDITLIPWNSTIISTDHSTLFEVIVIRWDLFKCSSATEERKQLSLAP